LFGFVLPLLALAGSSWAYGKVALVVAGLAAALVLVLAYFLDEFVHYHVFHFLPSDGAEWRREAPVVVGAILAAVAAFLWAYFAF